MRVKTAGIEVAVVVVLERSAIRSALPRGPGCYALLLVLERPAHLTIGASGRQFLAAGYYVYCGSAQGSGGLRARVARHVLGGGRVHWHVDYLRQVAEPASVWLWPGAPCTFECDLAAALGALPGAARAVAGFGSSDCRCPGHLVALPGGQ
jgi:Uri superfamily endonuclease